MLRGQITSITPPAIFIDTFSFLITSALSSGVAFDKNFSDHFVIGACDLAHVSERNV